MAMLTSLGLEERRGEVMVGRVFEDGAAGDERRIERAVGVPGAALGRLEGGLESGGAKKGKMVFLFLHPRRLLCNWREDANVRVSPQRFRS